LGDQHLQQQPPDMEHRLIQVPVVLLPVSANNLFIAPPDRLCHEDKEERPWLHQKQSTSWQ